MSYTKKELDGLKYTEVKSIAVECGVAISRPDGGGRRSKVELIEEILKAPDPVNDDEDEGEEEEVYLEDMSRKQLKAMAKELGLSASGSKNDLVSHIAEYYEEDEEDDEEDEDEDEDYEDDDEEEEDDEWEEEVTLSLEDLNSMTVKELRELAEDMGLNTRGRKAQLIDRIVEAAAEEEDEDEDDEEEDVDYADLTRAELKALAGARGLSTGGTKAALINRLEANDEEEDDEDEDEDDEDEEGEGPIASVEGPTGPVEVMMADQPVGASFVVTRVSADKWVITAGVVSGGSGVAMVTAATDNYDTLTRSELKDLLRERGLRIGGRKEDQVERLRAFDQESATTGVTKKFKGRAFDDEVQSDEYKEFKAQSKSKSYAEMKKWAKKVKAKWESHSDERIDRIRLTTAIREKLGVEKYKEEYQDAAARRAIKA